MLLAALLELEALERFFSVTSPPLALASGMTWALPQPLWLAWGTPI